MWIAMWIAMWVAMWIAMCVACRFGPAIDVAQKLQKQMQINTKRLLETLSAGGILMFSKDA